MADGTGTPEVGLRLDSQAEIDEFTLLETDGLPKQCVAPLRKIRRGAGAIAWLMKIQQGLLVEECAQADGHDTMPITWAGEGQLSTAVQLLAEYVEREALDFAVSLAKPQQNNR